MLVVSGSNAHRDVSFETCPAMGLKGFWGSVLVVSRRETVFMKVVSNRLWFLAKNAQL